MDEELNQLPAQLLLNQHPCVRGVALVQIGTGLTAQYRIAGLPGKVPTRWASQLPDTGLSLLKPEGLQPGDDGRILFDKRQLPDLGRCLG